MNIELLKEGDMLVYECGEDKCTFLYRRYLPGGFLDSMVGSNSYYLEHGKFLQSHFDKDFCRPATDAEKMEYIKLKINSIYV
jgi:hypothetical protein